MGTGASIAGWVVIGESGGLLAAKEYVPMIRTTLRPKHRKRLTVSEAIGLTQDLYSKKLRSMTRHSPWNHCGDGFRAEWIRKSTTMRLMLA